MATKKKALATAERKSPGIGTTILQGLADGLDNASILEIVLEKHPNAKTTISSIHWYRKKQRAENPKIPRSRDAKKKKDALT